MTDVASELKRRRYSLASSKGAPKEATPSKIYRPFLTVGHVTDQTPFSVSALGKQFIVTTSVGRNFVIYDASTLRVLFVSEQTPHQITALWQHRQYTYVVWSYGFGAYFRGRQLFSQQVDKIASNEGALLRIEVFAGYICVATRLNVYVYQYDESLPDTPPSFLTHLYLPDTDDYITSIIHLPTYLNKIVVATQNKVLLFNIRTNRLLFASDQFTAAITATAAAPALDTMAVGQANGDIVIYNLRKNRIYMTFHAAAPVSSLSFRTDGNALLAAGLTTGDIYFYNLDTQTIVHRLRDCHDKNNGGVSRVHFFEGQAIFATSGADNRLKEYVFDPVVEASETPIYEPPRILRERGGPGLPVSTIEFSDSQGHKVLSASQDGTFWSLSLRKASQNREISQRAPKVSKNRTAGFTNDLKPKLPEIIAIAHASTREDEWENVLTAHKDSKIAHTWSTASLRIGRWDFNTLDGRPVSAVAISPCGNFGVVGSSGGPVSVFNMQSGILRRKYVKSTSAVTGLCIDALNRVLVSCHLDGTVNIFDFMKGTLTGSLKLPSAATGLKLQLSSELLVVSLDLALVVIDITTVKVVRQLDGHTNRITSFDISPDSRWIVSTALDGTIRTWDIPTGFCIDAFRVPSVARAVRFSGDGQWLVTAHVGNTGLSMWSNKAFFQQVPIREVSEDDILLIEMPVETGAGGGLLDGAFGSVFEEDDKKASGVELYISPEQLDNELVSFTSLPRSFIRTLNHIDTIKKRNKAKEAAKEPMKVPFFLMNGGKNDSIDTEQTENKNNNNAVVSRLQKMDLSSSNAFMDAVEKSTTEGNGETFFQYCKSLSPSMIDLEIQAMNGHEPFDDFSRLLQVLNLRLNEKKDFDIVQAILRVFTRTHGDTIVLSENETLLKQIKEIETKLTKEGNRLASLIEFSNGLSSFFRSTI
ncbi:hypothetical protein CANCADRAFT_32051 [Tortispora caseinolytica NRRL Y-17796]|uniref:Uncharacterized protein n=1 Tax=Tortispora caseinolytica NRRL Y-17796 TaxID=767744 RepID=A0A1E4TI42_9ASCO|nr:hypothetical protein CANCADRAFT_32051 [Tortispora caseinolytica NRRL Y-17796]